MEGTVVVRDAGAESAELVLPSVRRTLSLTASAAVAAVLVVVPLPPNRREICLSDYNFPRSLSLDLFMDSTFASSSFSFYTSPCNPAVDLSSL